jgi:hypothetical protein
VAQKDEGKKKEGLSRRTLWVIGVIGLGLIGIALWYAITWYVEFVRQTNVVVAVLTSFLLYWLIADTFSTTGGEAVKLWFAKYDIWWSPWRMEAPAGAVTFMVYGIGQYTAFSQVIPGDVPDHDYHDAEGRFYRRDDPDWEKKFPNGSPVRPKVVYVGFGRKYHRRARSWKTFEDGKLVDKATKAGVDDHIFYFQTEMGIEVTNIAKQSVRKKEPVPVVLLLGFIAKTINPRRAEFLAGNWERPTITAVRSATNEYISGKTVAQLRREKDTKKMDLVDAIVAVNERPVGATATEGLYESIGIMVSAPRLADYDPERGDPQIWEAQKAVTIAALGTEKAKEEKLKKKEEGEGDALKDIERAKGIRARIDAYGSHKNGAIIALADALPTSKLTVLQIGQGNGTSVLIDPNPK